MAPLTTFDISVGLVAVAVASIAIYLFLRASSGSRSEEKEEPSTFLKEESSPSSYKIASGERDRFQAPKTERHLKRSDLNKARSNIRTLTLQSELFSMMLKRLFEAEDEGEITKEERLSLSRGYESDLKRVSEDLKRAELVVSLNELETIREDILKKFEATFNSTQTRIDAILKQLDIEVKKEEVKPRTPPRRRRPPVEKVEEVEDIEEAEEEEKPRAPRPKSEVEAKLEQLRNEVLKELEELDKLDLEA
jgi:uncharacterized protein (DUF4415 family)